MTVRVEAFLSEAQSQDWPEGYEGDNVLIGEYDYVQVTYTGAEGFKTDGSSEWVGWWNRDGGFYPENDKLLGGKLPCASDVIFTTVEGDV